MHALVGPRPMNSLHVFQTAAVLVAGAGAVADLRTGQIPNWLTLGAMGTAPVAHALVALAGRHTAAAAITSFGSSVAIAIACAALPLWLHARDSLGGGDVKLFAAVGALCRTPAGLRAELYAFACGALYAMGIAIYQRRIGAVIRNTALLAAGSAGSRAASRPNLTPVRFGPVIFLGTLLSIWLSWRSS